MLLRLVFSVFFVSFACADVHKAVFTKVYKEGAWGTNHKNEGWSGGGASFENTVMYRAFIEKLIRDESIKSVVDLGCGDWESTKYIDWRDANYVGYDVVKHVIEKNIKNHSTPNIHFFEKNFLEVDLPEADLMICKHVCQHISNGNVMKILSQVHKFKHCIFVNPVDPKTKTSPNHNTIVDASGRIVDLLAPPFNLKGKVYYYILPGGSIQQIMHVTH